MRQKVTLLRLMMFVLQFKSNQPQATNSVSKMRNCKITEQCSECWSKTIFHRKKY